jgi:hypothetical protein
MDEERDDATQETRAGGEAVSDEGSSTSQETAVSHEVVDEGAEGDRATQAFFSPDEGEAAAESSEEVTDEPAPPSTPSAPPVTPPAASAEDGEGSGTSPAAADRAAAEAAAGGHPELVAAGAFVGAFALAKVLKRLGGGD